MNRNKQKNEKEGEQYLKWRFDWIGTFELFDMIIRN